MLDKDDNLYEHVGFFLLVVTIMGGAGGSQTAMGWESREFGAEEGTIVVTKNRRSGRASLCCNIRFKRSEAGVEKPKG
jgi:hypothetical protein